MFIRLLSPFKEPKLLSIAIGHIFFQSLVISSQFAVAYIVALLVESAHSRDLINQNVWQVYTLLIFLVGMIGYLFIHTRWSTTSIFKAEVLSRVREVDITRFLMSQGHRDGIVSTGKTISLMIEGYKSWADSLVHIIGEFIPSVICLT